MKRVFIVIFSLLSCVFAQDWYSYMNKTHIDILRKFGIPNQISVSELKSLTVYEDSNKGHTDNDITFCYKRAGVVFMFDNQGNAQGYYRKHPLNEFFGENGILRVCGMFYDENCEGELPYGIKIGNDLVDVLRNEELGMPESYTPERVQYKKALRDDDKERGVKGLSKQSEVSETITVHFKEGKVNAVFIQREHKYQVSYR